MPEVDVEVTTTVTAEFEVFCAKCGMGLCGNCTTGKTTRRGMPFIQVEPCENCIKEAKADSESRGYDEGHGDGYSKGYDEGVESVTHE